MRSILIKDGSLLVHLLFLKTRYTKYLMIWSFALKSGYNRSVNLESLNDISRYFDLIGTSNLKHLNRFSSFGGVG